jgi:hypothetical protein
MRMTLKPFALVLILLLILVAFVAMFVVTTPVGGSFLCNPPLFLSF